MSVVEAAAWAYLAANVLGLSLAFAVGVGVLYLVLREHL